MNGSKIVVPELTLAEVQTLMRPVQDAYRIRLEADREEYAARFVSIDDAVGQITNLLGPVDAAPYVPGGDVAATIRSVATHDAATLAQHSGVALDLILDGMEILATATLDALIIISRELKNRDR